ncbi:transcriptional regulator MelR [Photobacterium aphoticum]|uniref:Transcriptional regulator n=1 Tax=Photobacterium aphoticum TaxID=754436 RepID=A0A0J1GMX3_9GAMM|nr:transcriptional regulator MelR [Photobacterium aphoticum]KLV00951.1 transcriptional regulator [Photobacterium aphoticum]PSU58877.1 transcriptional regulator MelR [Photobacterium aphoticum]GHA58264.1 transcriptional regulator MelR [Photobacterium aphoticum]
MRTPDASATTLAKQEQYSDANVSVSPLSLYSTYEQVDAILRAPHSMPGYHWHGQIEVNIPFGDDVEYMINGEAVVVKAGHIGIFWASVPHRLTNPGNSHNMGIINIPIHLFLSWPLSKELVNQITHGAVLQSEGNALVSEFELARWEQEMRHEKESRKQLATDEICLMLKRVCLDGWSPLMSGRGEGKTLNGVSKHAQFYVSQMLEYIASHHDSALTAKEVADHVGLHMNYAMGIFQRVMQMTIKQYTTAMRINHARALLSDTEKTILDIALTVGFNSSSRFYDIFQAYLGVTPKQYRQLSREDHRWSQQGVSPLQNVEKGACDGTRPVTLTKAG